MADDAVVSAYVAAPLCATAEDELARQGGEAGSVRVRALCLTRVEDAAGIDLAAAGANARRASEDSTAVAYLEPPGPATRFSQPILESAGIAHLSDRSGERGMARLMTAVREAGDATSLREAVAEALGGP